MISSKGLFVFESKNYSGWIVRMVFSDGTSVSVLGEEINMNGKLYKNGDSGLEDTLIEIYNNSNAEEKEYSFTLN